MFYFEESLNLVSTQIIIYYKSTVDTVLGGVGEGTCSSFLDYKCFSETYKQTRPVQSNFSLGYLK